MRPPVRVLHVGPYPSVALPDVVHVDASSTGCTPDGSKACPYPTIGQALDRAREGETILLRKGVYREDVVVGVSGVSIQGCGALVKLEGVNPRPIAPYPCARLQAQKDLFRPYERQAAVCIPPGVHDVTLKNLIVTGPGDGIQVVGATGVRISESTIAQTGSFGVRILEAGTGTLGGPDFQVVSSEVILEEVVVSKARGAGVYVSGSDLTIRQSNIRLTQPSTSQEHMGSLRALGVRPNLAMGWARGLAIRPSGWPLDGTSTDPESFAPSHVTISSSAITGNPELGLSVEGSVVTVEQTFIGALPQGEVSGPGIVVGRALSSGTAAELTVNRSVIERASDAAIDVLDAQVDVTNTTIRDTRGRSSDGCSGQGIRVRSLAPGDARSTVSVDHSVIVDSRQAAVLAGSATVNLTDSLLRGIAPEGNEGSCNLAMGDGVSIVDLPDQTPAQVSLERVRIDDARRAAIVKTGEASLSLASTVLACSRRFLVETGPETEAASTSGAICGCDTAFQRCERETEALPSWIVAGASPAWPGNVYEKTQCIRDFATREIPLVDAAVWRPDEPEVAPSVTLADGCSRISGPVAVESSPTVTWLPGFLAMSGIREARLLIPQTSSLQLQTRLQLPIGMGFPIDLPFTSINSIPKGVTLSCDPPTPAFEFPDFSELTGTTQEPVGVALLATTEPGWVHVSLLSDPPLSCDGSATALGRGDDPTRAWVFIDYGPKSFLNFVDCKSAQ